MIYILIRPMLIASFSLLLFYAEAQQVTGVWKGKIDQQKVELKIIQRGDSLTGTSYYYETADNYRRYSIKGYFDLSDNSVVWWDDQLIEDKGNNRGKNPQLSMADFNCPGGGEMYLEGTTGPKESRNDEKGTLSLTKIPTTSFSDEWDYVIDNYTMGTNDPYIIDSIELIAFHPYTQPVVNQEKELPKHKKRAQKPIVNAATLPTLSLPGPSVSKSDPNPLTIEEKFTSREKVFNQEIPLTGDSVELRFYDNAEIDGDSISLFLNDKLLFEHIRLSDKAYTLKLPVNELKESNELVMVAENLGSIPPNTSYMVAIVGDKRYEAQLASTENSSAMIKLRKE
jgi:hypothetical protein